MFGLLHPQTDGWSRARTLAYSQRRRERFCAIWDFLAKRAWYEASLDPYLAA